MTRAQGADVVALDMAQMSTFVIGATRVLTTVAVVVARHLNVVQSVVDSRDWRCTVPHTSMISYGTAAAAAVIVP